MIIVGLTGGIGSGKSMIARIFKTMGVPVFEADAVAKSILENDHTVKSEVIAIFGEGAYLNNHPNRKWIADQVFQNSNNLSALNQIIHPRVGEQFERWIKSIDYPYCIREAAILIESGYYKDCQFIISVEAPLDVRVTRVIQRDGVSATHVNARINNQLSDADRRQYATHFIVNDGVEALIPQVNRIHSNIIGKSSPL